MPTGKKSGNSPGELGLEDVLRLLNSFFRTARIDVRIVDFCLAREEIVIGFTEQIESFENELKDIKQEEGLRQPGRYMANVRLISSGREVTNLARFYKKADGSLLIEDIRNEEITLSEEEEINKPSRWKAVAKFGQSITEVIVKTVVEMWIRRL